MRVAVILVLVACAAPASPPPRSRRWIETAAWHPSGDLGPIPTRGTRVVGGAPAWPEVDLSAALERPVGPPGELAPSLASVRVDWPMICERRGRMSDDALAYVELWCAARRDPRSALDGLAGFARDLAVARAAFVDIANILAETAPARDALARIAQLGEPSELRHAALARAYLARGRDDDARAVIADERVPDREDDVRCDLELRDLLRHATPAVLDQLGTMAGCRRALAAFACSVAAVARSPLVERRPCATPPTSTSPDLEMAAAYDVTFAVERGRAGYDWYAVADLAIAAMPHASAEALAIAAVTHTRNCSQIETLATRPDREWRFEPALGKLVAGCRPSKRRFSTGT